MNKKNNKGFSLIELVIVITIMVILTALLAPQLLRYVEQSRAAKDAVTMDETVRAIELALTNEIVSGSYTTGSVVIVYTVAGGTPTGAGLTDKMSTELTVTLGNLANLPALVSNKYKNAAESFRTITIVDGSRVTYTHPS